MNLSRDRFFVLLLMGGVFLPACEDRKDLLNTEVYTGPTQEIDSIRTIITDSLKITVILEAPKLLIFENGNEDYPEGMYLQYFDNEKLVCTFRANSVLYTKESKVYRGEGNVLVKNVEDGAEMVTEELFWDPTARKFYTDKFVTIVSDGEIHTGEGLTADEDFTTYEIHKPSGTITVEENI